MTTNPELWDRFRAAYGPRPSGRLAQQHWEAQWLQYIANHQAIKESGK